MRRGGLAGEAGRDWRPRVRGVCRIRCGRSRRWVRVGLDPEGRGSGGQRWAQGSERAWTQARNHRASREAGVGAHLLCSRLRPGRRSEGRRENGPDREEGGAGGGIGPGLGRGGRQRGRQTQADKAPSPGKRQDRSPEPGPRRRPLTCRPPRGAQGGRCRVPEPLCPPPIQIPTVGERGQSARGWGGARGADSQWEAERQPTPTRRFRFRGEGTLGAAVAGFLSKGGSPDAPRGEAARGWTVTAEPAVSQESRALVRTRLSCAEIRAREPLPRVSVSRAGQWDRVQRRPQAGRGGRAKPSREL